jgi:outer membrane protein OmpA-like peptidoglycan-associated protein
MASSTQLNCGAKSLKPWAVVTATMLTACAPTPPPQAPAPPAGDLVVLVPNPEDGVVGRVTVSNQAGSVELAEARQSTRVRPGEAPQAVAVLDQPEVQRVFGPALAVVPEAPRHFNLYFELGSDTLTPESKALATEVVSVVRARTAPDVTVIGHTDTTDTTPNNVALGLRRANLIRDLLVKAGLDASLVEVASHGESDLLVPTADSTAEPKNRRVEVSVR